MASSSKKRRLADGYLTARTLETRRELKQLQLKSRFESIFEKYEKDFTGVGDEIDLETGRIIIDNGHIEHMKYERDVGDGENNQIIRFEGDEQSDSGSDISEDKISSGSEPSFRDLVVDTSASAITRAPQELEALDDADELGEFRSWDRNDIKKGHKPPHSRTDGIAKEGKTVHGLLQVPKDARKDEQGKFVERKWFAPPLPRAPRSRPTHRRVTLPPPIRLRDVDFDLGDWRHEESIWHERSRSKRDAVSISRDVPARSLDANKSSIAEKGTQWTKQEENLLYNFKTTTTLSDDRIAQLLRKRPNAVDPAWQRIRDIQKKADDSESTLALLDIGVQDRISSRGHLFETDRGAKATARKHSTCSFEQDLPHEIPDSDSPSSVRGTQEFPIEIDCASDISDHEGPEDLLVPQLGKTTPLASAPKTMDVDRDSAAIKLSKGRCIGAKTRMAACATSAEPFVADKCTKYVQSRSREIPDSQPSQVASSQSDPSLNPTSFEGALDAKICKPPLPMTPRKLPRPRVKWQSLTPSRSKFAPAKLSSPAMRTPRKANLSASAPNSPRKIQPEIGVHQPPVLIDDGKDDDLCLMTSRTPVIVAKRQSDTWSEKRLSLRAETQDFSDDELG